MQIFGDREIVVAREVSKMHEEFLRGTVSAVIKQIADREVKGEITIVVRARRSVAEVAEEQLRRRFAGLPAPAMRRQRNFRIARRTIRSRQARGLSAERLDHDSRPKQ